MYLFLCAVEILLRWSFTPNNVYIYRYRITPSFIVCASHLHCTEAHSHLTHSLWPASVSIYALLCFWSCEILIMVILFACWTNKIKQIQKDCKEHAGSGTHLTGLTENTKTNNLEPIAHRIDCTQRPTFLVRLVSYLYRYVALKIIFLNPFFFFCSDVKCARDRCTSMKLLKLE